MNKKGIYIRVTDAELTAIKQASGIFGHGSLINGIRKLIAFWMRAGSPQIAVVDSATGKDSEAN